MEKVDPKTGSGNNSPGTLCRKVIEHVQKMGKVTGHEGRYCPTQSKKEQSVMTYLKELAEEIRRKHRIPEHLLQIQRDPFGSLYIVLRGKNDDAGGACLFSHVDAVEGGGAYDGMLGVAQAMEALDAHAHLYANEETHPDKSLVIIAFAGEESSYSEVACAGSSAAGGQLEQNKIEAIKKNLARHGIQVEQNWVESVVAMKEAPWLEGGKLYLGGKKEGDTGMTLEAVESHIEQWKLLLEAGMDIGIVTGIAGARRWNLSLPAEKLVQSHHIAPENKAVVTVTINGEALHTGGTPPNKTEEIDTEKPEKWNRKDALLASSAFLREMNTGESLENVHLYEISNGKDMGHTVIPCLQTLTFVCNKGEKETVLATLQKIKESVEKRRGVSIDVQESNKSTMSKECLDREKILSVMGIAEAIEAVAREDANASQEFHRGNLRMTMTDFSVSQEKGLSAKIDARVNDKEAINKSIDTVQKATRKALETLGINLDNTLKQIAGSEPVEMSEEIVKRLEKIAEDQQLKAVRMKLNPGHDARTLAQLGFIVGMIAVAHEGPSHCPHESCPEKKIENACRLTNEYTRRLLLETTGVTAS